MKIRNEITTNYFHDEFAKDFGRLNVREEKSRRIYAKIIRCLFDFIKIKLYQGERFSTPIGVWKIKKVLLDTYTDKKYISHAASKLEGRIIYRDKNKDHFHKLSFAVLDSLQDRYKFRGLQRFVRAIHHHYD